jgi:transcriptional repressor NrdR
VEVSYPRLIKRDGSRAVFSESKLRKGLENALFKRPVPSESLDHAVRGILGKVRAHPEREIASRQVGEWVMDALARLDRVGYVRFASIYRSFDDVQAFRDEIDRLEARPLDEN